MRVMKNTIVDYAYSPMNSLTVYNTSLNLEPVAL